MTRQSILVVGATGLVGLATVNQALQRGWRTIGAARSIARLPSSVTSHADFNGFEADVTSTMGRAALAAAVDESSPTAVVAAINVPIQPGPLLDLSASALSDAVSANLVAHLALARAIVPRLAAGSRYVVCGGGMADVIIPGIAAQSVVQAGLRMLVRGLAAEAVALDVRVEEALIAAMVRRSDDSEKIGRHDLTDTDVAFALCELLEQDTRLSDDAIITLSPRS